MSIAGGRFYVKFQQIFYLSAKSVFFSFDSGALSIFLYLFRFQLATVLLLSVFFFCVRGRFNECVLFLCLCVRVSCVQEFTHCGTQTSGFFAARVS